ncbi:helix-turn-helix domain-containing protein [Candidatus Gracilibacteria bacterium]|nr:helix-turn-helix domain-containing protein [Candidatus Gracilibacteria bacterium]
MIEKFFTTEQVATILQVHPFTILKFIKQGKLKGIKLGRVYRITESDVREFLAERSTHGKNSSPSKPAPPVVEPIPQITPKDDDQQYYVI